MNPEFLHYIADIIDEELDLMMHGEHIDNNLIDFTNSTTVAGKIIDECKKSKTSKLDDFVPVEEDLPVYGEEVQVVVEGITEQRRVAQGIRRYTDHQGDHWSVSHRLTNTSKLSAKEDSIRVTHWRPLPSVRNI